MVAKGGEGDREGERGASLAAAAVMACSACGEGSNGIDACGEECEQDGRQEQPRTSARARAVGAAEKHEESGKEKKKWNE